MVTEGKGWRGTEKEECGDERRKEKEESGSVVLSMSGLYQRCVRCGLGGDDGSDGCGEWNLVHPDLLLNSVAEPTAAAGSYDDQTFRGHFHQVIQS